MDVGFTSTTMAYDSRLCNQQYLHVGRIAEAKVATALVTGSYPFLHIRRATKTSREHEV